MPILKWTRRWTAVAIAMVGMPVVALSAQQAVSGNAPPMSRDSIDTRVRLRIAQIVKSQLGLTDRQVRQLMLTNRRFEAQRVELFEQEREVRTALRDEIESRDTTRQVQVSELLDRMLKLQRDRLSLLEAEQKELATFLTPVQRARYFGLEEQIRRRVMDLRDQGPPDGAPGGARRPMGPGGGRRPPAE
ncbi:MAG: Spy/CpxP family protein refolding chaperone [Gemmatimonadaceae bacterium]|nr:Spy/CpxP family protein refolding chaperone [Gemmatimonadaceae bacterium]